MNLTTQLITLFVLAIPVACVAWTVTHEEVFREPRDFCVEKSKECGHWYERKFFYLFTCEYCFSHYVALLLLAVTRYQLLFTGWRGYLLAWFSLVWIANQYMSIYNRLRLDIKGEKIEHEIKEEIKHEIGDRENGLRSGPVELHLPVEGVAARATIKRDGRAKEVEATRAGD
jgi:hypothetical protein